jgi:V8-like Glu-specific endopeptidase
MLADNLEGRVGIWAGRHGSWAVATALTVATVAATTAFTGMAIASPVTVASDTTGVPGDTVVSGGTVVPGSTVVPGGAGLSGSSAVSGGTVAPASTVPPGVAVVHSVGAAAQSSARAFWTRSRMAAATPAPPGSAAKATNPSNAPQAASAPAGTPTATRFNGVPTVGALFYTTGSEKHFCTASVVDSSSENVILTAAHCVYSSSYAGNIEFVPGYHSGVRPYGAWAVKTMVVGAGWMQSKNPNQDFAFLMVTPPPGTSRPIQRVTGGLELGIYRGYRHSIEVIGYNDTGNRPVACATKSFKFETDQMEFYCHGYRDGTSGGPWILRYDSRNGTGVVFGVIGGFELGGDVEWASYSAYFRELTLDLLDLAEH